MPWVQCVTARGHSYTDWLEPMPRIPDFIQNSIVYLYPDLLSAQDGVDEGGSGFLIAMPSESHKATHYYVITNAHVIEDECPVVRVNLKYPGSGHERAECFDFQCKSWVIHEKHDLAIRPLPPDLDESLLNLTFIGIDLLVSQRECSEKDIGAGDDLVYVGRYMGHAGKFQNTPSVRFGTISMMPNRDEPIAYETGHDTKKRSRSQVGFLVEARSRGGYSGSPVFFMHRHARDNRTVFPFVDLRLLGVDWGHLPEEVPLRDPHGHLHGQHFVVQVHSGMMGVVPAWFLDEFIRTSPRLIEQRKRDDDWYLEHPPTGVADAS